MTTAFVLGGSLYHHFHGKDALFWAVLEGVAARVGEQLTEAERDDPAAELAAGERALAEFLDRLLGEPATS